MKSIYVSFLILLSLTAFVACSSHSGNRAEQQELSENQQAKSETRKAVGDSDRKAEAEKRTLEYSKKLAQERNLLDSLGLTDLKFGPLSEWINFDPKKLSWLNWVADREEFQNISYGVQYTISDDGFSAQLKKALDDPTIFSGLFEANKEVLPTVLQKTGLWFSARSWAKRLLPYFNGEISTEQKTLFDEFFYKYGDHDGYRIPRGNDEWIHMQNTLDLSRDELNNEYWMYLFAKRRTSNGGDELRKAWTEVLTFLKNMEPEF